MKKKKPAKGHSKNRKKKETLNTQNNGEKHTQADAANEQPRPEQNGELTPWPEPVHGPALLDILRTACNDHIIVPGHCDVAFSIWVVHTYCFELFSHTPRLFLKSPTRRCGKTRSLILLSNLVHRPSFTADATAAALFPEMHAKRCLLLDEYDSMAFAKDLRNAFNSGYGLTGQVSRKSGTFSTFTPIAIASITPIHPTMEDRSIKVLLKRKLPDEEVKNAYEFDGREIQRKCLRWVRDHQMALAAARPAIPAKLDDRAGELWTPLIAIADEAGGQWPALARKAALAISESREDIGKEEQLLKDIKQVFQADDKLFSEEIVSRLTAKEDSRWGADGVNKWTLADMLDGFSIKSTLIRKGSAVSRGYWKRQFEDAWRRWT